MKTIAIVVDDELDAALETLCAEQGRTKAEVLINLLRRYVEDERLKSALHDPRLAALYASLADEDVALAEEGMADYQRLLEATDAK